MKSAVRKCGVYALAPFAPCNSVVFHGGGVLEGGRWRLNEETWEWKGSKWEILP